MTTPVIDLVRPYAEAVRAALLLPADLVEELTDGLEADLVAALEDRMAQGGTAAPDAAGSPATAAPDAAGPETAPAAPDDAPTTVLDPVAVFGPPERYAAELCAAAGIEPGPAGPAPRPRLRTRVRARWAARRRRLNAVVSAQPWWPPVEDFLLAMRPVWWAARGWALFGVLSWLLSGMIPAERAWVADNPLRWALLLALVVLSAQWGRGRIPHGRWRDRLGTAASVLAVVLLVPALVTSATRVVYEQTPVEYYDPYGHDRGEDGVWVDGMQVSNLFVYDAEGELILGAQVFDDRGREVRTVATSDLEWALPGVPEPWRFLPVADGGRERWNVYPLLGAPYDAWHWDGTQPGLPDGVDPQLPPPPFARAPRVVVAWPEAAIADGTAPGPSDEATPSEDGEPTDPPGSEGDATPAEDEETDPEGSTPGESTPSTEEPEESPPPTEPAGS